MKNMNLFEMLPENEVAKIKSYIRHYAASDSDSMCEIRSPMSVILKPWADAKPTLYRLLGDNISISREVEMSRSTQELVNEIYNMDEYNKFRRNWTKFFDIDNMYLRSCQFPFKEMYKTSSYLYDDAYIPALQGLLRLLDPQYLVDNIYNGSSFEVYYGSNKNDRMRIDHGCKIIKAIGKVVRRFGIEGFEEFRVAHSLALNQKTVRGTLTLSIHPLDYMTMSDNECDWTSCMSWRECGDYRQGTVEMMNSPMVVVAYLSAKENMILPDSVGDWNNKKWRCLYIVNENMISPIKAYPYYNDELMGICSKWLKQLAISNCHWVDYTEHLVHFCPEDTFYCAEVDPGKRWYIRILSNVMYNDMNVCDHDAFFSINYLMNAEFDGNYGRLPELNYSGVSECMGCGQIYDNADDYESWTLTYECCEESYRCDCCGDRHMGNNYYEIDGMILCRWCYEDHVEICPICDNEHYDNDMMNVHLTDANHDRIFSTVSMCPECFDRLYRDKFFIKRAETYWGYDRKCVSIADIDKEEWLYKHWSIYSDDTVVIKEWHDCHPDAPSSEAN